MVGCLVFASGVLARAAYIQVIGDSRLESMSKRQFRSKVLVRPRRGLLLDRNGEPLAVNSEIQSLAANPLKIQNKKTLARLLSRATDVPYEKVLERLKEKKEFVWIKRHIPDQDVEHFKKYQIIDQNGDLMTGLWLVKENQRTYPHGELAAHVLGDVNLDSDGVEGAELWADEQLKGKVVSVTAVRDALGRPTFIDAIAANGAKDGESITLTLDASLQYSVEQELKAAVIKHGAKAGSVIVMDSVTGEILAMANEPSYNPNYRGAAASRRRNRVITDGYEPGSTVKPILLASALSNGMKLSDKIFAEHGLFYVQGKKISEAEAKEKFDWISLKKIIQVSSNIGAAKLALKVGADHFLATLKSFGIGAKTDIGFPGEISGRVPPRKSWQPLSLANIGFGQGILVTPIQMIRAYAAFANGGWLVQPTLLKSQVNGFTTTTPKRILSQQVVDGVTEALKSVTEEGGTGVKATIEGYQVAGKTGTAQAVDPATGKYSRTRHIASFIGFPVAPIAGNAPKLVIFTSIDEPQGLYFASETAAPLFRAVLNAAATRFSLPGSGSAPSRLASFNASYRKLEKPADETKDHIQWTAAAVDTQMKWEGNDSAGGLIWKMPGLQGLSAREAFRTLKGHHFSVEVHGIGLVKSQTPGEGSTITDGGTVHLSLEE